MWKRLVFMVGIIAVISLSYSGMIFSYSYDIATQHHEPNGSQGGITITVSIPDTVFGMPGDTVNIPVNTEDLTGLGVLSFEFTLSYDSTIITGIGVDTSGTLLSGTDWAWEYNVIGDIFSVAMAGADTLAGSGTLINLIFAVSPAAQPGDESPLHFVDFMFNEGDPPVVTQDGVFVVIEEGVEEAAFQIPKVIALIQNYPNPAYGNIIIAYQLPKHSKVSLKVYDAGGRIVKTLVDGINKSGNHSITWDGRDDLGKKVSSGIYYISLSIDGTEDVLVKKTILLR